MSVDTGTNLQSNDRTDSFSPLDARRLLRKHNIHPTRRLGQSFLVDPKALVKVVAAADLSGDETVLEVGAGLGALTCRLAEATQRVIAVEIDQRLQPALREVISRYENVKLVIGDILELDLGSLIDEGEYTVIANFKGSESYWKSHATTAFGVTEAAEPVPGPAGPQGEPGPAGPEPALTTSLGIAGVTSAIIAAIIALVIVWLLRKRQ